MLCSCFSDTLAFLPSVPRPRYLLCTSGNSDNETVLPDKNRVYIQGLHDNLTASLDKWIMTGNPATKQRAYNVLEQIQSQAHDKELVEQAERLLQRAGLPLPEQRQQQAQERQEWEKSFQQAHERSALSRRTKESNQPDNALLGKIIPSRLEQSIQDKVTLQKQLATPQLSSIPPSETDRDEQASIQVSSWIARAWNTELCSATIGGLDDVLSQIKRRIWTPLAAPPALLRELGIHPVRGLLLYGRPGCGKTLVARTLGRILSPLR
jgi:ATP-dependent 26S proteasome regulatory subunit